MASLIWKSPCHEKSIAFTPAANYIFWPKELYPTTQRLHAVAGKRRLYWCRAYCKKWQGIAAGGIWNGEQGMAYTQWTKRKIPHWVHQQAIYRRVHFEADGGRKTEIKWQTQQGPGLTIVIPGISFSVILWKRPAERRRCLRLRQLCGPVYKWKYYLIPVGQNPYRESYNKQCSPFARLFLPGYRWYRRPHIHPT